MNHLHRALPLAAVVLLVVLAWSHSSSHADQPPPLLFARVQAIAYPNGQTGFFDTRDGMLYIYEIDGGKCVYSGRVSVLGEPMRLITDRRKGG
ncbi:MAG: hypothetical protein K8S99_16010 [Planctomycetes bacterium]|nr:hypothetical protein [Planctomycetota bacterium]